MMTLISLAIGVAFVFSAAVTLGYPGMPLWEELALFLRDAGRSLARDAIDLPGPRRDSRAVAKSVALELEIVPPGRRGFPHK